MEPLNYGGKLPSDTVLKSLPSGKQDTSSTHVKHLSKSEIASLRQSKRDAHMHMLKLD